MYGRRLQTRLFLYLPHERIPRTLAFLNAAAGQVPKIEVAPVAQQDAVLVIGNDAEHTDCEHDQILSLANRTNPDSASDMPNPSSSRVGTKAAFSS